MKLGKVTKTVLKRTVLKNMNKMQESTKYSSLSLQDANAFLVSADTEVTTAVATVLGNQDYVVRMAFERALANLYVSLSKPYGITVSLTVPLNFEEEDLKRWMKVFCTLCEERGIDLLGGHTTISHQVSVSVVTVNAFGTQKRNTIEEIGLTKNLSRMHEIDVMPEKKLTAKGQTILLTKYVGMEGTIRLAQERKQELLNYFTKQFLAQAEELLPELSLQKEYEAIMELPRTIREEVFLHDVSEGGIFAALWDIAEYYSCGLRVPIGGISMKQTTIEFCERFDLNPYMLLSGGCALVVTEHPKEVKEALMNKGVPTASIGVLTKGKDKIIVNNEEERYLEPFRGDEYYKIFGSIIREDAKGGRI